MSFLYSRLDPLSSRIRLLILQPGAAQDIIRCELRAVTLDDVPDYEALSYCWGETTKNYTVHLVGQSVAVMDNLHDALHQLRLPDRERTLWVDALCINQADNQEKMHQVGMMGRIFQQCLRCIVWLGIIPVGAEYTLKDVRAVFDMITFIADAGPDHLDLPATLGTSADRFGAVRALHGMMLRSNKWWLRIWTVQEAVLPKDKLVVWQTLSISWETCVRAARGMMRPTQEQDTILDLLERELYTMDTNEFITPFLSLMLTGSEDATAPLFIAHRWRYREATDPRDKVYGLMGLIDPTVIPAIACDYTLTPAAVFTKFTLDILRREQSLVPLLGWRGEEQATPDLPTWVLDMVRPEKLVNWGCKFWEHYDRYRYFIADGGLQLVFETLRDGTVLSLMGIMVDTVAVVDEGIAVDERVVVPHEDIVHATRRRQQLVQDFFSRRSSGGDEIGISWKSAFFRTMLGDAITYDERVRRKVEAADEALFDAYLDNCQSNDVVESLTSMTLNQAFFITEEGQLGIGPPHTLKGDQVWVLRGSRVPFVLRPRPTDEGARRGHAFIGDAYVHNVMDGQFHAANTDKLESIWIE
jgi:heterokaryon incompatibility protein (HET)